MKNLAIALVGLMAFGCGVGGEFEEEALDTAAQQIVSLWWGNEVNDPADRTFARFGDTHTHTTRSDGELSPVERINSARNKGADFIWLTDHGRRTDGSGSFSVSDLKACLDNNQTSGAWGFSACGMEVRIDNDKFHHVVLDWNSDEPDRFGTRGYSSWGDARRDFATEEGHMVGVITHPGHTPGIGWIQSENGDWEGGLPDASAGYEYIRLIEINGATGGYGEGRDTYFRILNRGWHVSPVWATDMHHNWAGDEKPQSAGIWTTDAAWREGNYRDAFRSAAKARATFANYPGNSRYSIRMILLNGPDGADAFMGSTVPRRDVVKLRIRASGTNGNKPWTFRLYKSDDVTRAWTPVWRTGHPADCTSVAGGDAQEWEPEVRLPDTASWIVVEGVRDSGDRVLSAPIWFK